MADLHLVVVSDFLDYERGHLITDAEKVAEIMAGQNAHRVVKKLATDPSKSGVEA